MNLVRAWKDPEYRASLSDADLAGIPEHPAGALVLSDDLLAGVRGATTEGIISFGCCGGYTDGTHCGSCGPETCGSCDGCTIAGCTA